MEKKVQGCHDANSIAAVDNGDCHLYNLLVFVHRDILSLIIRIGNINPIANNEGPMDKLSKPS